MLTDAELKAIRERADKADIPTLIAEIIRLKDEIEDIKDRNYHDGRDLADW